MIVRAIAENGAWLFGKGRNDYRTKKAATKQNIKTRIKSFVGDCFFNLGEGIDWMNLLGSKEKVRLNLSVNTKILNTQDVRGITQMLIEDTPSRDFILKYSTNTSFGVVTDQLALEEISTLITEDGDVIITEDGDTIII